jgi:hypothetical protein
MTDTKKPAPAKEPDKAASQDTKVTDTMASHETPAKRGGLSSDDAPKK